jgi:hypothetical protein
MAGMSKSEYARHKAQQQSKGNWVGKVVGVALLLVVAPSLIIPFIGLVFVFGLIWNVIGDGLVKEDRY